jgi:type III pantothenate kinase
MTNERDNMQPLLMAVDIGNTNIETGLFYRESGNYELLTSCRLYTRKNITADELGLSLVNFLNAGTIDRSSISSVICSSVVPSLDNAIKQAVSSYFNTTCLMVDDSIDQGIKNCYAKPYEVGADRLVNAAWVHHTINDNTIIIDMGTATTLCAVTADGCYLGGVIIPGMRTSLQALTEHASRLTGVSIDKSNKLLQDSTDGAIKAGLYWSNYYALKEMCARLAREAGFSSWTIVASGGFAALFGEDNIYSVYEPHLTLKGLKYIYDRNN